MGAALVGLGVMLFGPGAACGAVFYAKDEALALAFRDGAKVESDTVFLSDEQVAAVKDRTGITMDSQLFTYYVARREGSVVGYAVIETHVVRTLPETFLAVLSPNGAIDRVVMLAFYEPPEYMPGKHWLAQFENRHLGESGWRLGRELHGISGATLTARAVSQALRKILVLHELVMRPRTVR